MRRKSASENTELVSFIYSFSVAVKCWDDCLIPLLIYSFITFPHGDHSLYYSAVPEQTTVIHFLQRDAAVYIFSTARSAFQARCRIKDEVTDGSSCSGHHCSALSNASISVIKQSTAQTGGLTGSLRLSESAAAGAAEIN